MSLFYVAQHELFDAYLCFNVSLKYSPMLTKAHTINTQALWKHYGSDKI